jgi:hypothetical protein
VSALEVAEEHFEVSNYVFGCSKLSNKNVELAVINGSIESGWWTSS